MQAKMSYSRQWINSVLVKKLLPMYPTNATAFTVSSPTSLWVWLRKLETNERESVPFAFRQTDQAKFPFTTLHKRTIWAFTSLKGSFESCWHTLLRPISANTPPKHQSGNFRRQPHVECSKLYCQQPRHSQKGKAVNTATLSGEIIYLAISSSSCARIRDEYWTLECDAASH